MTIIDTKLNGLVELRPNIFEDDRGYFYESYNIEVFKNYGVDSVFVQDNQSLSKKGVLRGLHFQNPPFAQGKLVRVVRGAVIDVAVDLRKKSPTYGQYHKVLLSDENKHQFWIPPGFAHGFFTLEENTIFTYKVSGVYNKDAEVCIRWDDPNLNIDWGVPDGGDIIVSDKDKDGIFFKEYNSKF